VFDKLLNRMWEKIRRREYVMTVHAEEEMADDGFTIFDVERTVLTGKITERQKDRLTSESKYLVKGNVLSGRQSVVVAKFGFTGKLVFITVYRK